MDIMHNMQQSIGTGDSIGTGIGDSIGTCTCESIGTNVSAGTGIGTGASVEDMDYCLRVVGLVQFREDICIK